MTVPSATTAARWTHFCAACGLPLRKIGLDENPAPHECDGDFSWLAGVQPPVTHGGDE